MDRAILNEHPKTHPYGVSLSVTDNSKVGVQYRALSENENRDLFMNFTVEKLKTHHLSDKAWERRKLSIESLRIKNLPLSNSCPYPVADNTRRGNFAEVVLAEYLQAATSAKLPVYRLRYNPNINQSMKGDDVLLFDLDSEPPRIIVGESKFRTTPNKKAVTEILDGLKRSYNGRVPISLQFVAERLFEEGNEKLGQKVQDCAFSILKDELTIDYVGFLMSDEKAGDYVEPNTTADIRNLLIISLAVNSPAEMVTEAFDRLEAELL